MKKIKSLVAIVTLTAMFAVTLAGCGKKEPDASQDTQDEQVTEEGTGEQTDDTTDAVEAAAEEPVDTRTPIQKFWDGDWYGIMWVTAANGNYEAFNNSYWDAMAVLDVDESGNADMVLWYEGMSKEKPVSEVKLQISEEYGSGEMGAALSQSGWIFANSDTGNGDVKQGDWIIDPITDEFSNKYRNNMIHIEGEYKDGSGAIHYHFFLRQWGELWDDVAQDPDMLIPPHYDEWYVGLVQDGYAMPVNIGEPGTVKMGEETATASAGTDSSNVAPSNGAAYDGSELVLVDDEYCKIVFNGMGAYTYNAEWIGYLCEITNKKDYDINFSSYADPEPEVQTFDSIGTRSKCYYNGEKCKVHFDNSVNAGATMTDCCLVIDGVTDVSQLGNVNGYISVVNNETGEILESIPYSF